MSLTKSAARRLALFTGSSMTASLAAVVGAGIVLAPTAALAANECGPGPDVTCPAGTYNDGITYNSAAEFTMDTTGSVNASDEGVEVTATGAAGIAFTPAGNVSGTGGADFTTGSGDITLTLRGMSIGGGLRATSTSGDILIERVQNSNTDMVVVGGGDITIRSGDDWGGASITGNTDSRIVVDSSSGPGLIHILNRNGELGQSATNFEGLDATIGSGGLVLDILGTGPEGGGISTVNASIVGGSRISGGIVLRGSGAAEINLARTGFFHKAENFGIGAGVVNIPESYAVMQGPFNASGDGSDDDPGLLGGLSINVDGGGAWIIDAANVLSPADDAVRVGDGGFLMLPYLFDPVVETQTVDFGGGNNHVEIGAGGHLVVGLSQAGSGIVQGDFDANHGRDVYEAELRFDNLQTFVNDGDIWMGTSVLFSSAPVGVLPEDMIRYQGTDQVADDILALPGATFIGGPNGRIRLDADLNSISLEQASCDSALRDAGGTLPVADCINLQNGAMEGTVLIAVTQTVAGGRGAYNPDGNVIIDMSDGAGGPGSGAGLAADAVVGFAPESRFYSPAFGGILDNGMFAYQFFYDAEAMQVKLIGVPSAGAFHQPLIANAAQSAWRSANATFFERQADLRDTLRAGETAEHGVWMRASYDAAERSVAQTFSIPSGDITYDNTHDVITTAVTLGADFVRGGDGDRHWVAGGMIGYVRTDMEYADFWTDTAKLNGMMVGLYGTWIDGPMFVDAVASGVWSGVVQDMPQAELFRERDLSNDAQTIGARIEAGWQFDLGMFRLDPLAHASWSRAALDDFKVPEDDPAGAGNDVLFETAVSTRAGVGLRGSTLMPLAGLDVGLSLTGRYSKEFDGEASAAIGNLNPISPVVTDEFAGNFGEVIGGVTVADPSGRVSGALNLGVRQGDDYEAVTASASFRYQW